MGCMKLNLRKFNSTDILTRPRGNALLRNLSVRSQLFLSCHTVAIGVHLFTFLEALNSFQRVCSTQMLLLPHLYVDNMSLECGHTVTHHGVTGGER